MSTPSGQTCLCFGLGVGGCCCRDSMSYGVSMG